MLASSFAQHVVRLPDGPLSILLAGMKAVSPLLPTVRDANYMFEVNASYSEFDFQVVLFDNDFVGVQFYFGAVNFTPQWANPCWEFLAADVSAEQDTILRRLREALHQAARAPWLSEGLRKEHMDTTAVVHLPWWWRLLWPLLPSSLRHL